MSIRARDIAQSVAGVKNTFSSWDSCMAKSYCKWPVIIGIVLGSLIVLSVVFCVARCLCCGVECCCACCACFNRCCPSPRGRREKGYEQAPPTPYQHQYQPPAPMQNPHFASGAAAYRANPSFAQTATFESPSRKVREDSLPEMPSWQNASSKRIEQYDDDVELEKMEKPEPRVTTSPVPNSAQNERLLNRNPRHHTGQETRSNLALNAYRGQDTGSPGAIGYAGNNHAGVRSQETGSTAAIGYMDAGQGIAHAQPYHGYNQQRQQATSPYGEQRGTDYTGSYEQQRQQTTSPYVEQRGATGYAASHEDHSSYAQNSYSNVSKPYPSSGYDRNPSAPSAYRSPLQPTRLTSPTSHGFAMNGNYQANETQASSYTMPYPATADDHLSTSPVQAYNHAQPKPYEIITAPLSYKSGPGSPTSPPNALTPGGGMNRKPVQGNWREV